MGFAALALLALLSGFADQLYTQESYDLAALEYARVLFEEGDTLGHPQEALRLARCLHLTGEYERALSLYTFLAEGLPDGDQRAMAWLGAGTVYSELGMHSLSRDAYVSAAGTAGDSDLVFRAQLLGSLSPLYRMEWMRSSTELSAMALTWPGARGLLARELSELAAEGEHLPRKSPFWCGAASALIPGCGQMICGHTTDGLIALGMNAAVGLLLYFSIEEENTSTTVFFGWLAATFYGANVIGGGRAAEYANVEERRNHFRAIYDRLESWNWDYQPY
jgi:tetratricopeptide (TPR) repeat protein